MRRVVGARGGWVCVVGMGVVEVGLGVIGRVSIWRLARVGAVLVLGWTGCGEGRGCAAAPAAATTTCD